MADKKAPVPEEKVFNIPLRREWISATRIEKTKKSVIGVKKYIMKHTKATDVKISPKLNDMLWASGAKKPLKSITLKVSVSEGVANARLPEEITLEEEKKKFLEEKGKKGTSAEEKPTEGAERKEEAKAVSAAKPEETKSAEEKVDEKPAEETKEPEKK